MNDKVVDRVIMTVLVVLETALITTGVVLIAAPIGRDQGDMVARCEARGGTVVQMWTDGMSRELACMKLERLEATK